MVRSLAKSCLVDLGLPRIDTLRPSHRATWKICLSKSAVQEVTDACWFVVCCPTLKPTSDSACTRMLLTTARKFGTLLGLGYLDYGEALGS